MNISRCHFTGTISARPAENGRERALLRKNDAHYEYGKNTTANDAGASYVTRETGQMKGLFRNKKIVTAREAFCPAGKGALCIEGVVYKQKHALGKSNGQQVELWLTKHGG